MYEKFYMSPTTPGLKVNIINYLIELVCINCNKRIGPRFWTTTQYWKDKYKREIKGVYDLLKELKDIDSLKEQCLITCIKKFNVKCLNTKKTRKKIIIHTDNLYLYNKHQKGILIKKQQQLSKEKVDNKNYKNIDMSFGKNKINVIKDIENG